MDNLGVKDAPVSSNQGNADQGYTQHHPLPPRVTALGRSADKHCQRPGEKTMIVRHLWERRLEQSLWISMRN